MKALVKITLALLLVLFVYDLSAQKAPQDSRVFRPGAASQYVTTLSDGSVGRKYPAVQDFIPSRNEAYQIGDFVKYNGQIYECLLQTTTAPDAAVVTPPGPAWKIRFQPGVYPYVEGETYPDSTLVSANGVIYLNVLDAPNSNVIPGTGWEPQKTKFEYQKGINGIDLDSDIKAIAQTRQVVSNQAKTFKWQKAVQDFERGNKDLLSIALIGDSKISDQDTWQRPLYEMMLSSGLVPRSYGYVSFSFREDSPYPSTKTRSASSSEYSQSTGDTLLGPDMNAVLMPQGVSTTFYTEGLPTGLGEHAWDSLVVHYWQRPTGGTVRVRDSRGNQYGDFSTAGAESLQSLNIKISNGLDISPRVIIESLVGDNYMFGIEKWNTEVEKGFVINKYGGSGSNYTHFKESDDRSSIGIIAKTSPDFILLAHGINHRLDSILNFKSDILFTHDQIKSNFPDASIGVVATTYGGAQDLRADLYSNYIDSLIAISRLDAALINLNNAYYDNAAENTALGVTPDGTHYEDFVGPTNAQFLYNLLFPTYSSNAGTDNDPSFQQYWNLIGNYLTYTDNAIEVSGILNTEFLPSETPEQQADRVTLESRGQAIFGDSNSAYPKAKLTVTSNLDAIVQSFPGRGVLDRSTLALVEDISSSWTDGDIGPHVGFYSSSDRKFGYIGMYRDGTNTNFTGLTFGVHGSNSSGVDADEAMRITRIRRVIIPRLATDTPISTQVALVGVDAVGTLMPVDGSSVSDNLGNHTMTTDLITGTNSILQGTGNSFALDVNFSDATIGSGTDITRFYGSHVQFPEQASIPITGTNAIYIKDQEIDGKFRSHFYQKTLPDATSKTRTGSQERRILTEYDLPVVLIDDRDSVRTSSVRLDDDRFGVTDLEAGVYDVSVVLNYESNDATGGLRYGWTTANENGTEGGFLKRVPINNLVEAWTFDQTAVVSSAGFLHSERLEGTLSITVDGGDFILKWGANGNGNVELLSSSSITLTKKVP